MTETYQWMLAPRQPEPNGPVEWDAVRADGHGDLVERTVRKLELGGGLYNTYAPELLGLQLDGPLAPLWERGHVTVAELWEAYSRYLYLHRLTDVETLCACVQESPARTTWASQGVGVAEAFDERTGTYLGAAGGEAFAGTVGGTTLVVRPEAIEAQRQAERRGSGGGGGAGEPEEAPPAGPGEVPPGMPDVRKRRLTRFYGVAPVDADRIGRDAARLASEVVAHLNAVVGSEVEVTIEVSATNPEGFGDDVIRIVDENAATLRFRSHGFEET